MRAYLIRRFKIFAVMAIAVYGCTDTVIPIEVASITVDGPELIHRGESAQFSATFTGPGGESLVRTPTWSSTDPSVATVSQGGEVTGVGPGATEIQASADGRTGGRGMAVRVAVGSITLAGPDTAIHRGLEYVVAATVRDEDGEVVTDRAVGWSSSDPGIVAVNGDGELEANWPGAVVITAESEGVTAEIEVRGTLGIIAFESQAPGGTGPLNLYQVPVATGHWTDLFAGERNDVYPNWSPDGRRLVFSSRSDPIGEPGYYGLATVDLETGGVQVLVRPEGANRIHPRWSPDGTRIVYADLPGEWTSGNLFDLWDIVVINADGSNPVNLTGAEGQSDVYPAWSPDGTQIVFARMVDGVRAVFRMNADGSGVTRVTPEGLPGAATGPYWSPTGDRIAYWGWNGASYDIYLVDPDGGNLTNLTDSHSDDVDPTWSPDGSRIAFRSNRDGTHRLYVLDIASGALELIDTSEIPLRPVWSP